MGQAGSRHSPSKNGHSETKRLLAELRESQELNLILENLRLTEELRDQDAVVRKLQIQSKMLARLKPAAKADGSCQTEGSFAAASGGAGVVRPPYPSSDGAHGSSSEDEAPSNRISDDLGSGSAGGATMPTLLTCVDETRGGGIVLARSESMNSVSSLGSIDEDRDCTMRIPFLREEKALYTATSSWFRSRGDIDFPTLGLCEYSQLTRRARGA